MTRARAARPDVVLFDVFETLVRLEPLRQRFTDAGRPGHELELFFARTLRDGMAYTLAGDAPSFRDVAAAQLDLTTGHTLSKAWRDHILDSFADLPLQPDAEPALDLLAAADVPAYGFTHGSSAILETIADCYGIRHKLRKVLSAEAIRSFKPPAKVYEWACEQTGTERSRTALVAVHSWDTHGAVRAGLLAGFATRLEGGLPAVAERPHVVAERVDQVVAALLEL
ncbi:haloacid dehalogenase [Prauserella cavernicola]|uniref:Haloacid dehalogenase n=1 Tax=Prauserella cavernicola TaxID=2800127 RepID=A0A934V4A9_9PSEU|nr:haloacid dehalogenase [Prauserella cavernicola]MBK1788171.1 haloacid dehalogenase [Prauserella cavernicola]